MYRIGLGFDIHRTKERRKLYIGGINIPSKLGLDGHSDADLLIHTICDAILGALALGDIGEHFSNKEQKNKNKRSTYFLKKILIMFGSIVILIIFLNLLKDQLITFLKYIT